MAIHQRKILTVVFTTISVVGFLLLGGSIFYFIKQNEFGTYQDRGDGRFKLKYPKNWTVAPYTDGTYVIFYSPAENALDIYKESVNIVVQDMTEMKIVPDLQRYTQTAINQMQAVFKSNFVLLESKPALMDGSPGHQIVFIAKGDNDMKFKIVWTLRKKKAYQFTYGGLATQYDKYIKQVDAMLRSMDLP